MKRLAFLIWLLASSPAWSDLGRVYEDVSSPITYYNPAGCDSVVIYVGNDSTSWLQDSLKMDAVFNADKTCWLTNITLTATGSYTVKFNYYETGAASVSGTLVGQVYCDTTALKITDNVGINFGDVTGMLSNSDVEVLSVDVQEVYASITAASRLREVYDNDGTLIDMEANIEGYVIASDTNIVGETLAVMPNEWVAADSAAYQGSASGLTAQEVIDSLLAQTNADTVAASLYAYLVRNVGGGSGASAADIWNYNITDFKDTTSNFRAGQYQFSVGLQNVEHSTPTLHMKVGAYTGAVGSNIEDDFDSLFADIAAMGGGAGTQAETVYVYDTGNSVTVPNIPIQARNSSGTNLGQVTTNSEGYGVLNQDDAATIYVRISGSSGYLAANNPETISVASPYRDTVYVTAFSPTAPVGDLCTVWGFVKDANQVGIPKADISAIILQEFWPIRYGQVAIVARHSVKSDSVGYYELPIYPSTILLTADGDSSSYYMITATKGAQQIFQYKVTVPDSSTFEMVPDSD